MANLGSMREAFSWIAALAVVLIVWGILRFFFALSSLVSYSREILGEIMPPLGEVFIALFLLIASWCTRWPGSFIATIVGVCVAWDGLLWLTRDKTGVTIFTLFVAIVLEIGILGLILPGVLADKGVEDPPLQ